MTSWQQHAERVRDRFRQRAIDGGDVFHFTCLWSRTSKRATDDEVSEAVQQCIRYAAEDRCIAWTLDKLGAGPSSSGTKGAWLIPGFLGDVERANVCRNLAREASAILPLDEVRQLYPSLIGQSYDVPDNPKASWLNWVFLLRTVAHHNPTFELHADHHYFADASALPKAEDFFARVIPSRQRAPEPYERRCLRVLEDGPDYVYCAVLAPDMFSISATLLDRLIALSARGETAGSDSAVVPQTHRWQPSPGYVGTLTIKTDPRFKKEGKNPTPSTIARWVARCEKDGKPVVIVKSPDRRENHYPEEWVLGEMENWHPRKPRPEK